jgi:ABC-type branched-subunit amino acid transport system ATPase component
MLEVDGLDHSYARHRALRDVSIRVTDGEVVAILGANGAGKTTLLNAIAGLLRPSAGSIRFRGDKLTGLRAHRIVEKGIATVTETRHLFGPLSVAENLSLGAYTSGARRSAAVNMAYVFELFPRLAERRRQAVRTMSGGEQQMVAVGRALMARPSLLLLDKHSLARLCENMAVKGLAGLCYFPLDIRHSALVMEWMMKSRHSGSGIRLPFWRTPPNAASCCKPAASSNWCRRDATRRRRTWTYSMPATMWCCPD